MTQTIKNEVYSKNGELHKSFASIIDDIILNCKKDTSLQNIAHELNELAKVYKHNVKYTKSTVKAHIKFRLKQQTHKKYLSQNNLRLDEKNFILKVKKGNKIEVIDK